MSCGDYKLVGSLSDDCDRKQYCSLRECIKDKVGEASVLPPELQDQMSDLLKRMAALEKKKLEVTMPGGIAFLTGEFNVFPRDGRVTRVMMKADNLINSYAIYRNGTTLVATTQVGVNRVNYDCDFQVHSGDTWFVDVGVVGNEDTVEEEQPLADRLDMDIKIGQIALLQNTGNWHPDNLTPAEQGMLKAMREKAQASRTSRLAITSVFEFNGSKQYLTWGDME